MNSNSSTHFKSFVLILILFTSFYHFSLQPGFLAKYQQEYAKRHRAMVEATLDAKKMHAKAKALVERIQEIVQKKKATQQSQNTPDKDAEQPQKKTNKEKHGRRSSDGLMRMKTRNSSRKHKTGVTGDLRNLQS